MGESERIEKGENRVLKGIVSIFKRSRSATLGLILVVIITLIALLAPHIAPHDPLTLDMAMRREPPGTPGHLLGTDNAGRDLLSRIIWGSRISLQVGVVATGLGIILGTVMGLLAGFYGGAVETLLLRLIDILICFPTLLLALAIVAMLGPAIRNVMIAVGVTQAPRFARIVRSSVLSVREMEYVESASAMGASSMRIMFRHLLPNAMTGAVVFATLSIGAAILTEATLSFLGLGVPPPTPSWGNIVAEGRRFLLCSPWITVFPGLAIMVTVFGFNFFGDGLRDALDPRLRGERDVQ